MKNILFRKDINNNIRYWLSNIISKNQIEIKYGKVTTKSDFNSTNEHLKIIQCPNSNIENTKIIRNKLNQGYKVINFNYEDDDFHLTDVQINDINSQLGKYATDSNNNLKVMLCTPFVKDTLTYPVLAQPKINGVRATIKLERVSTGEGFFEVHEFKPVIRSKSGLQYCLPHIEKYFNDVMFYDNDIELKYDGELYIPNTKLNIIRRHIPYINSYNTITKSELEPNLIQFWSFDLCIPDITQKSRLLMLTNKILPFDISLLMRNKVPVISLPSQLIKSDSEALTFRDYCISLGFEGCVLRSLDAEYSFGNKPKYIMKYKKEITSEFIIVDIVSKTKEDSGMFVLKNDINECTFVCNPEGTLEERTEYLRNKDKYVGKLATVKYYERSGVNCVPFHANVITIRNYE